MTTNSNFAGTCTLRTLLDVVLADVTALEPPARRLLADELERHLETHFILAPVDLDWVRELRTQIARVAQP